MKSKSHQILEIKKEQKQKFTKILYASSICELKRFYSKLGRKTYVTPTSYLHLISGFKTLITSKQSEIMGAKRRYVNGLEKLAYAEVEVAQMSKDLEALQPQLKIAAEEAEVMIGVIEIESKQAAEQASIVQNEEAAANEKAAAAQALKVCISLITNVFNYFLEN